MLKRLSAIALLMTVLFAACGDDDATTTTTAAERDLTDDTMSEDMGDGEMEEFIFGEPMEAETATRVIEITANDDFTFEPSSVVVTAGETVTFRVTNAGVVPHDFTLGDTAMQDEHEAEMATMGSGMMHEEPNVFALESGETKEMTWHLTETGELVFGCHQIGHYAAGMRGTVTVQG